MKHIHILAGAAAFSAVALASCTKDAQNTGATAAETGTITINLVSDTAFETKAVDAYTGTISYESAINRLQLLIFDESGDTEYYSDLDTGATSLSASLSIGKKTIYVTANGPDLSGIMTLGSFKSCTVDLSSNSRVASTGFVMSGSSTCTVEASTTSACTVKVRRLASRVVLKSVTNNLPVAYGTAVISNAFLANVVGTQNVAGDMSLSDVTWYNKYGRVDGATDAKQIIGYNGGNKPTYPNQTFQDIGKSVENGSTFESSTAILFYPFANSSTTAPTPFSTGTFTPQRTVLVVSASFSGHQCYYPVVLDKSAIEPNKTYTVALTLSGLGSSDPAVPVVHGSLSATISISDWETGETYEESI